MNIFNISTLFFAVSTFLLGWLVFLKRQDELGKKWLFFSLSAAWWGFFCSLWTGNSFDREKSYLWMQMSHAGSILIPATWLDVIFTFLGNKNKKIPRRLLTLLYLGSFSLLLTVPTPYFMRTPIACSPFNYYTQPGLFYHLFTAIFFAVVGYGFFEAIKAFRSLTRERRQELQFIILGAGIGFLGGGLSFLPVYGFCFPQYNLLMMPLYPFIMTYAMTRHRVFDLEELALTVQKDKLAAIGLLSSSINHEIKNPLLVIKGFSESLLHNIERGDLEILSKERRVEKIAEVLKRTIEQVNRASEIAQKLTDFSKAVRSSEREALDLESLISNVLFFVKCGLEMDKIKVDIAMAPKLSLIGNRRELEQVFLNLIMNACQAMPRGGDIRIVGTRADGRVRTEIADTGEGISAEKIERLFEPFYTTKEMGTGLGLYITKQLIEKNDGRISVQSHPGGGTVFTLEFSNVPCESERV